LRGHSEDYALEVERSNNELHIRIRTATRESNQSHYEEAL